MLRTARRSVSVDQEMTVCRRERSSGRCIPRCQQDWRSHKVNGEKAGGEAARTLGSRYGKLRRENLSEAYPAFLRIPYPIPMGVRSIEVARRSGTPHISLIHPKLSRRMLAMLFAGLRDAPA